MRVNKMYCDLCGVEIESEEELNKLVTDFYVKTNGENFELCNECAQKIRKTMENIQHNRTLKYL